MHKLRLACFIVSLLLSCPLFSQQKNFSIYLIGDAGEPDLATNGLKEALQKNYDPKTPAAVIFLGDNIYPKGMPEVNNRSRAEAEQILRSQINLLQGFNAQVYFVPGNHDWKRGQRGGWQQINREGAFIDSLYLPNVHFQPEGACPGPVEVPLGDEAVLVIVDSQWFLHRWDKPEGDDSPCDVKRPEDAVVLLEDIFVRNQGKRIIVAAHHPLYTYGEHGGVFTWKDHLFPLLDINKSLYIPMPAVGSIYPLFRKYIGDIQDTQHPIYKRYIQLMSSLMEKYPGTIYAAGHEHALQYAWKDSVHYITSGAGSKYTFVKKKGYSQFADPAKGFVKIDIASDGASAIQYFEIGKDEPVYQVNVKPVAQLPAASSQPWPEFPATIRVHASDRYDAHTFRKKILGENYRDEWKQDIDVPVFDIGKEAGGLKIVQKGGGMQTLSLRLTDSLGQEYTLRSIEKFPEKAIPSMLQKTFASDLVQDQISSAHPYGAVVVPYLADAAGIYHSNPRIVYIPDDPRFGIYRKEFANTLMLFEERPGGDARDKPYFGSSKKIISTDKVLAKLAEDNDNEVDQKFVLRSRLFDIVIGDWDRHDDQWRWASFKDKKNEYYRPIPRDRDQAFFVSNGVLSKVWSRRWALPKFEGFHEEVRWTPGFMFNARFFDRTFLTEPSAADWIEQAKSLQQALTDETIEAAIKKFPEPIYKLHGEEIIRKLKSRRDHLQEYALEHYKFLAREVTVQGSNKREYFEVVNQPDGDVIVNIYKINKSGDRADKLYSREFFPHETREVRLLGLGGDDVFQFTGEGKGKIAVRVLGGDGADSVQNTADIKGWASPYKIYDTSNGIAINSKRHLSDKTSNDPAINTFDRRAFKYPVLAPLVYGTFNYDDGVFIGGGFLYTTHGFRKTPFKNQHLFLASYAPLTSSYNFKYDGRFSQVFGKWGVMLDFDVKAPNFVNNFFGWGNETRFNSAIKDDPHYNLKRSIDYYRLRLEEIDLQALLTHPIGGSGLFKFGPVYQRVEIERPKNDSRFIVDYANTLTDPLFENTKTFAGLHTGITIDTRDKPMMTTRGIYINQYSTFMKGFESDAGNFTSHNASIAFYQTFRFPAKLTFALRAGGGVNTGNYQLYQAQILDGKTELRGFRKTRFYGDKDFYSNNEVRLKVASFRSYLFPASVGVLGFYDIGRVWYKDANGIDPSAPTGKSNVWHHGVGGGVWLTPFNLAVVSAEVAHSEDGNMFYVRLGYLF
ncbi:BamA/TamA family outer membrane protein [Ohtaekwangia sp.]|uniref:BamA/TamA family outer membrane protein n=1 Tax=Ohtaekwangia sp. TaxID=2066019 RepID=UPI002FDDA913